MAQPPYQQPPATSGGSGLDPKLASTLCYALWWITGVVFLFIDKENAEVRFHAWQSIAFFGGVTVLNIGLNIIAGITGIGALGLIGSLANLVGFIVWIIILIQTYQGKRMVLPIAGPFAEAQAAKG